MKIVVLDGHTLNPGDLSWDGFGALGEVTVHERTPVDQVAERIAGAEAVITNKAVLSRKTIEASPQLRYVGVTATGVNIVDLEAADASGVTVTNAANYGSASVTQAVFAHVLHFTQRVGDHAEAVKLGRWSDCPDFCFWDHPLVELDGLTLGILGYGAIGRAVAQLGRAFGMKVIAHSRSLQSSIDGEVRAVDRDALFRESDVLTLHCPLTEETDQVLNAESLATMKPTAFLINTGRGQLVDEAALADALEAGQLAGAGLDVLSSEPPSGDNPLIGAKNCFITPHLAWATKASRERLMAISVDNLRSFLDGQPTNLVNRPG
jgi:glycerate dehydrogenase